MKYIFIVLVIFLQASLIFGQNHLSGVVLSEDERGRLSPVAFANVYWQNTNIGTSTDSVGVFHLALSEESNQLIVSFVGFESDTIEVKNFSQSLTIQLEKSNVLDAVEIEARQRTSQMSFINPIQTELITERELFKAACCNLSESFETNPSVDVSYTDAVTGTKQINMLGLAGKYTMISRENMPGIRMLGNSFGLSFIPGSWISSIQVSKGAGSVVNGFESMTGQINVELKKPDEGEMTFLNLFANQSGRTELNFVRTEKVAEHLSTTLLIHGNVRPIERDQNNDGFRDFPLQEQINVMNRWKYEGPSGLRAQFGIHYLDDSREGGQLEDERRDLSFGDYNVNIDNQKLEAFAKTGIIFTDQKYKSMGLQLSAVQHEQSAEIGLTNYQSEQRSFYANYIYQSIIKTSSHKFKTGLSFQFDQLEEEFNVLNYSRNERVPGVFYEYTYSPSPNLTLVAGVRGDHSNYFGTFITPRLHFRWASSETTVFRVLAGSGRRTANPFAENLSYFASGRKLILQPEQLKHPYGFDQEVSTNIGFNLTKDFRLDYRDGYLSADVYRTEFQNRVVIDLDQSSNQLWMYNLDGVSYSNVGQIELSYELIKFLDLRMAYRYVEAVTKYRDAERLNPFVPKHRAFVNLAYQTQKKLNDAQWLFDMTWQWTGIQRLPSTSDKSLANQRGTQSNSFSMLNAQVTRNFNKTWAVYVGMENIFNYRQNNPIIDASNPFGNEFDAAMVWGPIFGRMVYGGLRFKLEKE